MDSYKLYMSLRSPFARRIRLILEECGIQYDPVVLDAFNPPAFYMQINPLGRVPVLELSDGEILIDSNQILMYLRDKFCDHDLFRPRGLKDVYFANRSALAIGVMEWTITWFLESIKPSAQQDLSTIVEAENAIARTFLHLENEIQKQNVNQNNIEAPIGYWDLDLGAAIGYAIFRIKSLQSRPFSDNEFGLRYPGLHKYYQELMKRSSFIKSAPKS